MKCAECGMVTLTPNEYHPFAACLMFKSCHDSAVVRSNLDAIREDERKHLAENRPAAQDDVDRPAITADVHRDAQRYRWAIKHWFAPFDEARLDAALASQSKETK